MGAHTTTDDPTRYRLSGDVESWKLKDPIARVEAYVKRNGLAEALSLRLQAGGSAVPAHLLHTLPYVASLVVFVVTCARLKGGGGPEALRAVFAR